MQEDFRINVLVIPVKYNQKKFPSNLRCVQRKVFNCVGEKRKIHGQSNSNKAILSFSK